MFLSHLFATLAKPFDFGISEHASARDLLYLSSFIMSPFITGINDAEQDGQTKQLFPHIEADPTTLPASLDPFTIVSAKHIQT